MNAMLFNFCLMIFWAGLALCLLIFGPLFAPNMLPDRGRGPMLGMAAAMLAVWNFVRFWTALSARKSRREAAATYREQKNPKPASNEPKPVLNPEFQFNDQAKQQPPEAGNHE